MHRFFVEKKNILRDEQLIFIDEEEDAKHIDRVLRLQEGELIEICDGDSLEYKAEIQQISKKKVVCKIIEECMSKTEAPIEVTLYQGIPKSSKMEIIIQKCTELGIHRIVPMITERTVVQLKDRKAEEKKVERWQRIAYEAAKQSKRGIIPLIEAPLDFHEMISERHKYDIMLIPYEKELSQGMKAALESSKGNKKIAICIGPEGGFEEDEIIKAKDADVIPVTLGPRILRTETAGLTVLSILMYELGDLGGI